MATINKKKNMELINDSIDMDRGFNPFKKRSEGQANISIGTLSPLNQVIILHK